MMMIMFVFLFMCLHLLLAPINNNHFALSRTVIDLKDGGLSCAQRERKKNYEE